MEERIYGLPQNVYTLQIVEEKSDLNLLLLILRLICALFERGLTIRKIERDPTKTTVKCVTTPMFFPLIKGSLLIILFYIHFSLRF